MTNPIPYFRIGDRVLCRPGTGTIASEVVIIRRANAADTPCYAVELDRDDWVHVPDGRIITTILVSAGYLVSVNKDKGV